MADRYVDSPPAGAEAWREVWESNARYGQRRGWLIALLQKVLVRINAGDVDRQKDFNIAALDLLRDLRSDVGALREDLKRDISALQLDMRQADEALAREIARVRELLPIAAKRNDALIAAVDQKIETVAARLRDASNPYVGPPPSAGTAAEGGGPTTDLLYRRIEDSLRGPVDVERYVELARTHQPVIDIGCGRGEFLLACRDAKIDARGFDINERSVADLHARGIDAKLAGVPGCFEGIEKRSVGSILAIHVVEHLPVELLFAMFRKAARALRPGGLLMIETPNAESLLMAASDFWRDPTHLAPRHPAALTVLAREHGFSIEEIRAIHPLPEGNQLPLDDADSPSVKRLVSVINERVFGPQDVRLILRLT